MRDLHASMPRTQKLLCSFACASVAHILLHASSGFAAPRYTVDGLRRLAGVEVGEKVKLSISSPEGLHRMMLTRAADPNPRTFVTENGRRRAVTTRKPILFKGFVERRGAGKKRLSAVAADLFDGQLNVMFFGHRKRIFRAVVPDVEGVVDSELKGDNVPVELGHVSSFVTLPCGVSGADAVPVGQLFTAPASSGAGSSASTLPTVISAASQGPVYAPEYTLDMGTDADFEFYQAVGSDVSIANAFILSAINLVSAVYQSQIGIKLTVSSQNVFTSSGSQPYTNSDAGVLLGQFLSYTNATHQITGDAYHLFTGKDVSYSGNSAVAGLAYVGVICNFPTSAYGLSERRSSGGNPSTLQWIITAHEIGHNFSANHDSANLTSIMSASVSSANILFSNFSLGEITGHVDSNHGCLSSGSGGGGGTTPDPTPTSTPTGGGGGTPPAGSATATLSTALSAKGKFAAKITIGAASATDCAVTLYGGAKTTDLTGTLTKAKKIFETTGGDVGQIITASATNLKRRPNQKSYFVVKLTCPTYSTLSNVKSIKANAGRGTAVTAKSFFKYLGSLFSG